MQVSLSPDGRQLAILSSSSTVFIRPIDSQEVLRVPGVQRAAYVFWSPDSRTVGFGTQDGKLMKTDIAGGSPLVLTEGPRPIEGVGRGTWSSSGVILFGPGSSINQVPISGGRSVTLDLQDRSDAGARRSHPDFLPDEQHFLYLLSTPGRNREIRVGSLNSRETKLIAEADSEGVYSRAGYLLFIRGTVLMAQQFDARALTLIGEAKPVTSHAIPGYLSGNPSFSTSQNNVLAYITTRAGFDAQLSWFDRQGMPLGSIQQPAGVSI